jgi:hypothetical protein
MIGGRPPSDLLHVLEGRARYRDYFLDGPRSTIAIEINLADGDDPARFDRVVRTFQFGQPTAPMADFR